MLHWAPTMLQRLHHEVQLAREERRQKVGAEEPQRKSSLSRVLHGTQKLKGRWRAAKRTQGRSSQEPSPHSCTSSVYGPVSKFHNY